MLKCDFCDASWHLDCLDPPLANPPNISLEASQRDAWRCPRHLEHDLRSGLLVQNDLNDLGDDVQMADAAPVARVARKVRKLKNAEAIESTFSRGMRNNGLIDIINDPDDDTDGEGNYVFGQGDSKDLNAKVFRVPERGVILDFVSRVKRYAQSFSILSSVLLTHCTVIVLRKLTRPARPPNRVHSGKQLCNISSPVLCSNNRQLLTLLDWQRKRLILVWERAMWMRSFLI